MTGRLNWILKGTIAPVFATLFATYSVAQPTQGVSKTEIAVGTIQDWHVAAH
jgi:hypothetical protein